MRSSLRGHGIDSLAAATLAGFAAVEAFVFHATPGPETTAVVVAVLGASALPWRRRAPVPVAAWVGALLAVPPLLDHPADSFTLFVVALLVAYSVGANSTRLVDVGVGLGLLTGGSFIATSVAHGRFADYCFSAVLYGLAVTDGQVVQRHAKRAAAAAGLASRLDQIHESQMREALSEERSRIAREMHDVISHSVSLMVIQAGAAEATLASRPAEAQSALSTIQDVGTEAVSELGRLLGVLRHGTLPSSLAPQPGIQQLARLAEASRAAGLDVDVRTVGVERRLPPGVDVAAYRIVQEALTNVRKHAPGSSVTVTVRYGQSDLDVAIDDNGPGLDGQPGVGHGLIGMKERAAIYGGRLTLQPSASGGLSVRVVLPLAGSA